MKRFVLLLLAVAATGCADFGSDPAYTMEERHRQIARNWDWEGKQIVSDIDHALLLRPMTHLTLWDLR
jgi:hypothetical protein